MKQLIKMSRELVSSEPPNFKNTEKLLKREEAVLTVSSQPECLIKAGYLGRRKELKKENLKRLELELSIFDNNLVKEFDNSWKRIFKEMPYLSNLNKAKTNKKKEEVIRKFFGDEKVDERRKIIEKGMKIRRFAQAPSLDSAIENAGFLYYDFDGGSFISHMGSEESYNAELQDWVQRGVGGVFFLSKENKFYASLIDINLGKILSIPHKETFFEVYDSIRGIDLLFERESTIQTITPIINFSEFPLPIIQNEKVVFDLSKLAMMGMPEPDKKKYPIVVKYKEEVYQIPINIMNWLFERNLVQRVYEQIAQENRIEGTFDGIMERMCLRACPYYKPPQNQTSIIDDEEFGNFGRISFMHNLKGIPGLEVNGCEYKGQGDIGLTGEFFCNQGNKKVYYILKNTPCLLKEIKIIALEKAGLLKYFKKPGASFDYLTQKEIEANPSLEKKFRTDFLITQI